MQKAWPVLLLLAGGAVSCATRNLGEHRSSVQNRRQERKERKERAEQGDCSFAINQPGAARGVLGWPETNFHYNVFLYDATASELSNVGLKITGEFHDVNWFGLDVVDMLSFNPKGSFIDREIKPDPGSFNPFKGGPRRVNGEKGRYTIEFIPESYRNVIQGRADTQQRNIFFVGSNSTPQPLANFRIWDPLRPEEKRLAELPKIEARRLKANGEWGDKVPCPDFLSTPMNVENPKPGDEFKIRDLPRRLREIGEGIDFGSPREAKPYPPRFVRLRNHKRFVSPVSEYMAVTLDPKKGWVGIVRFKKPKTVPLQFPEKKGPILTGDEDMRAFSICLLDAPPSLSFTGGCVSDYDWASSDEVIFVVGPTAITNGSRGYLNAVKQLEKENSSIVWTQWGAAERGTRFWFNQMDPNPSFEGSATEKNVGPPGTYIVDDEGKALLGEYTPLVTQCTVDDFKKSGLDCGKL